MKDIKVNWKHSSPDYPAWLHDELDSTNMSQRVVEIWEDGTIGYASKTESHGQTELSEEAMPSLAEISADSQFEPFEISKEEFEQIWKRAISRKGK